MILEIILNLVIVIISVVMVVLFKSLKTYKNAPMMQSNIFQTSKGILSIIHENNSKKVSESIEGAEKTLKAVKVDDFSIDSFFDSLNK